MKPPCASIVFECASGRLAPIAEMRPSRIDTSPCTMSKRSFIVTIRPFRIRRDKGFGRQAPGFWQGRLSLQALVGVHFIDSSAASGEGVVVDDAVSAGAQARIQCLEGFDRGLVHIAVQSKDDAPGFFGQETRYGHRVYGGVLINVLR